MAPMHKSTVIAHYGTISKMSRGLRISRQAIYGWPELIPERWAWMIEGRTGGALKVNPRLYEKDVA